MDDLEGWVVVVFDEHNSPNLYWNEKWEKEKKWYEEEYPDLTVVPAKDYDKDKLADAIIEMIGSDLESENRHSINGIQDTIYEHLIKGGVNKFDAASAIYEGFKNI